MVKINSSNTLKRADNLTRDSFHLCDSQLDVTDFKVRIHATGAKRAESQHPLLPYSLSGAEERIEFLFRVPGGLGLPTSYEKMELVVIAPEGYEFVIDSNVDFIYKKPFANSTEPTIQAADEDWPGLFPGNVPGVSENVLHFTVPEVYEPNTMYGFQVKIRVPDTTAMSSINAFYAGFYFANSTCFAAGVSQTGEVNTELNQPYQVRASVNAKVDYLTTVEGKDNNIIFTLESTSLLEGGGYIEVTGPPGFGLPVPCTYEVAPLDRDAPYEVEANTARSNFFPAWITCETQDDWITPNHIKYRLKVAAQHPDTETPQLIPGMYRWQVPMTNPSSVVRNDADASSPCGFTYCWTFELYNFNDLPLELATAASSFRINTKMTQATIVERPEISWKQWAGSGRNNRPTHYNPLVFSISLGSSALNPDNMTIRAPAGYTFREDCLQDIDTRADMIFGGEPLIEGMTAWVPEVLVKSCRGDGPDARLLIDPGVSLGLLPNKRYPFRLAIFENPRFESDPNKWSLDYNGEASDPFEGFKLWTFHRTSVLPVTVAYATPVTGATQVLNPVTFTVRPYNRAAGRLMQITVTAPPGYTIVSESTLGEDVGKCELLVQPVSADYISLLTAPLDEAPPMNFLGPPGLIWGQADFDCQVHVDTPNKMEAIVLAETREMMANRDYQITVFVNNPQNPVPIDVNLWKIETSTGVEETGDLPTYRDEVILDGFSLNERALDFLIVNSEPGTGVTFTVGQQFVPGLYFQFKFPVKLIIGDIVRIKAPFGFKFQQNPDTEVCPNFRFELGVSDSVTLPNTAATPGGIKCVDDEMIFDLKDQNPTQGDKMVGFRIDTRNPPKTPHIMQNFWLISHETFDGQIRSSEAYQSWEIFPPLKQISIIIVGDDRAAGSDSAIGISFMPVSDADELKLVAKSPNGFSFTGASALSMSHEVIETDVSMVRVRCAIYADVQVDVRIGGMRLGNGGGPTVFDLETRLGNGMKMDESKDITEGAFRLPGKLTTFNTSLLSVYQQHPEQHKVTSLLGLRMGETGLAVFHFSFTIDAPVGNLLRLRSPLYTFFNNDMFKLELVASRNIPKLAPVVSVSGGEIIARLDHKLYAGSVYRVQLEVQTPSNVRDPDEAKWSIDIDDGSVLPVNTDDEKTLGFGLVSKVPFQVETGQAPPMAQVTATLNLNPGSTMAKFARVIAAPEFNFTENCLQAAGDNGELLSCQLQSETIAGCAVARLEFAGEGLASPPSFMQISIITPGQNKKGAYANSFFIQLFTAENEEVGWGEDAQGVQILQMLNSGVVYPAIPEIAGILVYRFTMNKKVDENGMIECGYPDGFLIQCNGDFLKKVSLQGTIKCDNYPLEKKFVLTMKRPLPPGSQAFAVTATPPFEPPTNNKFYIMIKNPEGLVMDAAMELPGLEIQPQPKVQGLDLFYSTTEPERSSTIGLGFELLVPLPPENPEEYKLPVMYEAVIEVPNDFTQNVQKLSHIELMAGSNPLPIDASTTWLVNTDPKRLRIFFDEDKTKVLGVGRYKWTFPVMVPARLPAYNVFTMTICERGPPNSTGANATCNGAFDKRALVTFPFPGFNIGDRHPAANEYAMTGAAFINKHVVTHLLLVAVVAWRGMV
jgi:hypothetical protein